MDSPPEEAIDKENKRTVSEKSITKSKIENIVASKLLRNDCDKLWGEAVDTHWHIRCRASVSVAVGVA
jgi:hypothetical protein